MSHRSPSRAGADRRVVGESLPAILTLKDLEAVLGLRSTRIYELYKAGAFDFAVLPAVGNSPRFSGKKIQEWIDGTRQGER